MDARADSRVGTDDEPGYPPCPSCGERGRFAGPLLKHRTASDFGPLVVTVWYEVNCRCGNRLKFIKEE